jgi:hypothetical protein
VVVRLVAGAVAIGCAAVAVTACAVLIDLPNPAQRDDAGSAAADVHADQGDDVLDGGDACASSPRPCPAGALVCEGFEGAIDRWTRAVQTPGEVGVTSDAFRGCRALRAFVPAAAGAADTWAFFVTDFAPSPGELHVRAWLRIDELPPDNAEVVETRSGTDVVLVDFTKGVIGSYVKTKSGTFLQAGNATAAFPLHAWTCFELVVAPGAPGTVTGFVSGTKAFAYGVTVAAPIDVRVGWVYAPRSRDDVVIIDDVVVRGGAGPIGCD